MLISLGWGVAKGQLSWTLGVESPAEECLLLRQAWFRLWSCSNGLWTNLSHFRGAPLAASHINTWKFVVRFFFSWRHANLPFGWFVWFFIRSSWCELQKRSFLFGRRRGLQGAFIQVRFLQSARDARFLKGTILCWGSFDQVHEYLGQSLGDHSCCS